MEEFLIRSSFRSSADLRQYPFLCLAYVIYRPRWLASWPIALLRNVRSQFVLAVLVLSKVYPGCSCVSMRVLLRRCALSVTASGTLDEGFASRILQPQYWIMHSGSMIHDAGSMVWGFGSSIIDTSFRNSYCGSMILDESKAFISPLP